MVKSGDAERLFKECAEKSINFPLAVISKLALRCSSWLKLRYALLEVSLLLNGDMRNILTTGSSVIFGNAANSVSVFFAQQAWQIAPARSVCRLSWLEMWLAFVAQYGRFPGFLYQDMTIKTFATRFQVFASRLFKHFSLDVQPCKSRHLRCFSFGNVPSFYLSLRLGISTLHRVWAILIKCSLFVPPNSKDPTNKMKPHYGFDFVIGHCKKEKIEISIQ